VNSIHGYWYPKDSSARERATLLLRVNGDGECQLTLGDSGHLDDPDHSPMLLVGYLDTLSVSDRVGNIPRQVIFTDGSMFETKENDALDLILSTSNHPASRAGWLHRLESRWKWIATALVLTLVLVFSFFKWGLPWGANKLAYAMPVAATQKIGEGVLELMDAVIFDASALSVQKQATLRKHFETLAAQLKGATGYHFALHFRQMKGLPNAMALPSGDIVITDTLITMAENQQEIDAVLLHEIGHVVHRHGLQQVIQSTFVTVLLASVTGDISGSSDVLLAFPAFLLQSQYARHHETDADTYAFKQMMALDIDPKYFASMMQRMAADEEKELDIETKEEASSYFSSHPVTSERIKHALEYSKQFKQK